MPLVVAEGAGAEMRRTLGTAVFAGMLGVTLFGIFLTPVFFYVIQWLSDKRAASRPADEPEDGFDDDKAGGETGHSAEVAATNGECAEAQRQRRGSLSLACRPLMDWTSLATSNPACATTAGSPKLHVVLVEPEIALNTGSIGRTWLGAAPCSGWFVPWVSTSMTVTCVVLAWITGSI